MPAFLNVRLVSQGDTEVWCVREGIHRVGYVSIREGNYFACLDGALKEYVPFNLKWVEHVLIARENSRSTPVTNL